MKYKTILIIIAFFNLFLPLYGQNHGSATVKGKIKSLDVTWYVATDSGGKAVRGNRNERQLDIFDERNNIIEVYSYYAPPALSNKEVYKYDKDNRVKEVKFYDTNGVSNNRQVYFYNSDGKEIETKHYYPDSNTVDDSMVTKYYGNTGVMTEYEWREYYKAFKINRIDTFELDKMGNCIEVTHYPNNEPDSRYRNIYDSIGNMIECDIDSIRMGDTPISDVYKYDEKGNETSIIETNNSVTRISNYKYEFDKKGNWIKQIEMDDGKPTWIIERIIVYR